MEWTKEDFWITTDKGQIDLPYVHHFLSQCYWAQNIPVDVVRRSIDGSVCFSLFHQQQQIGFARVITDSATFAYLADVFVDESWRRKGLSKWLMHCIMNHLDVQGLRRFALITRDAHGLYKQFGFEALNNADLWMQVHRPDVYSNP